jgi:V/A-type H+-transporting ATPase subunit I
MSIHGLERNVEALKHDLAGKDRTLEKLAGYLPGLMKHRVELADRQTWLQAHAGMEGNESLLFLQGYSPEDAVEGLRRLAEEEGWGIVVDDPGGDEQVPTLVRNSKFVRIDSLILFPMMSARTITAEECQPWRRQS